MDRITRESLEEILINEPTYDEIVRFKNNNPDDAAEIEAAYNCTRSGKTPEECLNKISGRRPQYRSKDGRLKVPALNVGYALKESSLFGPAHNLEISFRSEKDTSSLWWGVFTNFSFRRANPIFFDEPPITNTYDTYSTSYPPDEDQPTKLGVGDVNGGEAGLLLGYAWDHGGFFSFQSALDLGMGTYRTADENRFYAIRLGPLSELCLFWGVLHVNVAASPILQIIDETKIGAEFRLGTTIDAGRLIIVLYEL